MDSKRKTAKNIDEYISWFPEEMQERMQKIRETISKAAPKAQEKISYAIPAFNYYGDLMYFAGFKKHISVYPAPRGAEEFKEVLSKYAGGKGTVQFPNDEKIPYSLITKMVKYRMKENEERKTKSEKLKAKS
jgi:uncharacterized protein YdhG (YjbR/CyaY superfamily)